MVAMPRRRCWPSRSRDACSSAQPARRSRTFCWTTEPSTLPLAEAITAPMTLPISCIEVAPVAEIASSISASTVGVGELFGGEGLEDLAFGPLLLGELGATGGLERLDRLGAPLDLLAGDLADLVVGELAHDLLLAVGDRGREHAERAETDLLPGPQGRGHLLVHLDLQRGVAHVDSPPVLSRILLALASIAVVCIAYGVAIERRAYRLVRRGLAILPADGPESVTVLHLSDLHFVSSRSSQARVPRLDPAGRRHRRDGRLPGRARGRRDRRGRRARDARTARLVVRARLERLLRPARDEPAPVLHPAPTGGNLVGLGAAGRTSCASCCPRTAGRTSPTGARSSSSAGWRSSSWVWTTRTSVARTCGSRPGARRRGSGSP